VEIGYRGVVRSVLTEDLSTIGELALQSFAQNRIEWLILRCADIQTTERKCDDLFEALEVIGSFGRLPEILRCK